MKTNKSLTTAVAAAAMAGLIGIAYAQTSTDAAPESTSPAATQTMQQPAMTDAAPATPTADPAATGSLMDAGNPAPATPSYDANTPSGTSSPSTTLSNDAPADVSATPPVERAAQPDRN